MRQMAAVSNRIFVFLWLFFLAWILLPKQNNNRSDNNTNNENKSNEIVYVRR